MTVDVEELVRSTLAERASAMSVDRPAWEEVVARRRGRAWVRPALVVALALAVLGVVLAVTRPDEAAVRTVPAAPSPNAMRTFEAVDHRVTGAVVTLEEHQDWTLVAFPSTVGPCVGVMATDTAHQPRSLVPGFPWASAECATDLDQRRVAAFRVAIPDSGPPDEGGRPPVKAAFVVGLTVDPEAPLTTTIDEQGSRPATLHPLPFAPSQAAFALETPEGSNVVVRQQDVEEYPTYGVEQFGPGEVVASSDDVNVVVHGMDDIVCIDLIKKPRGSIAVTTSGSYLSGQCQRRGMVDAPRGTSSEVATAESGPIARGLGTAPADARAVRLLDARGHEVGRVPVFTGQGKYGVGFFVYDGPPIAYRRAEPVY